MKPVHVPTIPTITHLRERIFSLCAGLVVLQTAARLVKPSFRNLEDMMSHGSQVTNWSRPKESIKQSVNLFMHSVHLLPVGDNRINSRCIILLGAVAA